MPVMVQISFGLYNTCEEIDTLIEALKVIAPGNYTGEYKPDPATGELHPIGWEPAFDQFFSL
jgi:hypothetical protein